MKNVHFHTFNKLHYGYAINFVDTSPPDKYTLLMLKLDYLLHILWLHFKQ